ncbi:lipoprotein [Spiroplasma endosymbiont of Anurida maritima]|uniref:lipoprotein n=1 Tax=Spiroplasma endosymbiont of Anurida maritima TaxID=2967972 RepID=UPI0036D358FF
MKKLLSILGSITIVSSAAATVIACAPINQDSREELEDSDTPLLLRDISKIINSNINKWMKNNVEFFEGQDLELFLLKNIFNKANKDDFPINIKPETLHNTIDDINFTAVDVLLDISKEISSYDRFSHLFLNLEPEQIIQNINFKNFYMQNFDLVEIVLERKHIDGWEEALAKAESISNTFNLFTNFNVVFSYVENRELKQYSTKDSMSSLYLTENKEILKEVIFWLQKDIPNVWEIIKNYGLTYEGHKGVEAFSSVEKLYEDDGDIVDIARLSTMEDGSAPDISKFNVLNANYETTVFNYSDVIKSQTNSMLYDDRFTKNGLPWDDPDSDFRKKPVVSNHSLISNMVNYNTFKKDEEYWLEGSDGDISFDFGTKENFIEVGLYGNIMNVQDLVDSRNGDGVLWGKIPGILSYDRSYNTYYEYIWDKKTYTTDYGLQDKYYYPLSEFYKKKEDLKFVDEETKNRLTVQDNYRIESGSNEGVFTQTNLVDGGDTSIIFWTYDNIPLPMVENITTFIMTEKNKTLNDSYRDVLSYAYDILIEKQDGSGLATSPMSNIFRNSVTHRLMAYRAGLILDGNYRLGTNSIILKSEDFDKAYETPRKPSEVIETIFNQQKTKIDEKYSWIPESYIYSYKSDNYLNKKGITDFVNKPMDVLYMDDDYLDFSNPNWKQKSSNPLENVVIYIGGIGFPIHNYNTYKGSKKAIARWNLGTTNFTFVKETNEFKAKYLGYIFN